MSTTHETPGGSGRPDGVISEPASDTRTAPSPYDRGVVDGRAVFATVRSMYLPYLVALFVGVMLISNITATKGVVFFPDLSLSIGFLQIDGIVTDGAFFLFPLAYILGDVISEVYGFKTMRRVVFAGFAVLILAAACYTLTIQLPAADFYDGQEAFERVAGVAPIFLLAGLTAYVIGELLNSYVLVWLKRRTGEKTMWARLMGSTVVGQFADTLVFCTIAAPALGMVIGSGDYWNYTILGFLWKTLVEFVFLPLTYVVIGYLKQREPSYQAALRA